MCKNNKKYSEWEREDKASKVYLEMKLIFIEEAILYLVAFRDYRLKKHFFYIESYF